MFSDAFWNSSRHYALKLLQNLWVRTKVIGYILIIPYIKHAVSKIIRQTYQFPWKLEQGSFMLKFIDLDLLHWNAWNACIRGLCWNVYCQMNATMCDGLLCCILYTTKSSYVLKLKSNILGFRTAWYNNIILPWDWEQVLQQSLCLDSLLDLLVLQVMNQRLHLKPGWGWGCISRNCKHYVKALK